MAIQVREATIDDAEAIALAHMRGWQVAYKSADEVTQTEALAGDDIVERRYSIAL